jgi:hypothetical protein
LVTIIFSIILQNSTNPHLRIDCDLLGVATHSLRTHDLKLYRFKIPPVPSCPHL